jgi:hypothetical protein
MPDKNYVFVGQMKAVAIGAKDVSQVFEISNSKSVDDLNQLIKDRQELGKRISQLLKDNGVDTASDEDTVVG